MSVTETLAAALRQPTVDPLVRAVLTLGETTLTYGRSRILSAEETMEPYSHVGELLLDNADGELTSRDLRGYRLTI
ncbi:MAG: hypothetical protein M0R22_01510, partial [Dehalococcoidia bacterium]|nr:hypothetical protein [Dehalococcoidia bacterium]